MTFEMQIERLKKCRGDSRVPLFPHIPFQLNLSRFVPNYNLICYLLKVSHEITRRGNDFP
jgi:hypothetical protein